MRILLTGGGTGGHVIPLIAVAKEVQKQEPETKLLYLGALDESSKKLFEKVGIKAKKIITGKWRRYSSTRNIIDLFKIPLGILSALWKVLWYMPDVTFSKGGHGSLGPVLATWFYRIPCVIHESDAVAGAANQFLARFVQACAISFETARKFFPKDKVVFTGNPVREEILLGDREEGINKFKLDRNKKTILVIGGSQGAQKINKTITISLPYLLKRWNVVHLTGPKNIEEVEREVKKLKLSTKELTGYHPFGFLEEKLRLVYAATDLVVSRAGANVLTEIAATGRPAILVPLSSAARDHQRKNAIRLEKYGAVRILDEQNFDKNILCNLITELFDNPDKLKELSENVKKFFYKDATKRLAELVLGTGRGLVIKKDKNDQP